MELKIDSFFKNKDSARPQVLGWAKVTVGGKLSIWMTLLEGKSGNSYCKLPSCRVGTEYVPAITFSDQNKERELSEAVKGELKKGYLREEVQEELDW